MKFIYEHLNVKASSPAETARLLTEHVQEVDRVEHQGIIATGVITAHITDVQKHPHADRLQIVTIDNGSELIDIVTGAPNVKIGQIVAFAPPGAKVRHIDHQNPPAKINETDFITIKPTLVRGIESPGMLCGADEIGIINEASMELHEFSSTTPIGVPIEQIIPTISTIETDDKGTAHRPDLLSYRGIEQELAAILDKPYSPSTVVMPKTFAEKPLSLKISQPAFAKVFLAARIDGMKTHQSSPEIIKFLADHGIKSINLATDVTNLVMLKEGHPLHAFSTEAIKETTLSIRQAKAKETITTLNHLTYNLTPEDLVIADTEKPLDLAGIIGGTDSAVKNKDTSIILTAAAFNPKMIRQTSRRLGVRTDASARFERGPSVNSTKRAFVTALQMITEISGGKVTAVQAVGTVEDKPIIIKFNFNQINQIIGTNLQVEEMEKLLQRLGYQTKVEKDHLTVVVPEIRSDVSFVADVAEDIARIYGFNSLPVTTPIFNLKPAVKSTVVINQLRHILRSYLYEAVTDSMVRENKKGSIEVQNPIGDKKYLRQTLLPGLFDLAEHFTREGFDNFGCFEIGQTYRSEGKTITEKKRLAFVIAGDEIEIKGYFALVLHRLHLSDKSVNFVAAESSSTEPSAYQAVVHIMYEDVKIGSLVIKIDRGRSFYGVKLYLEELIRFANFQPVFKPYSKLPVVKRDLAFIMAKHHHLGDIYQLIYNQSNYISDIHLFDRFSDQKIGSDHQSIALHLIFQDKTHTLTDEVVNEIMQKIEQELMKKYEVTIR